MSLIVVGLNHRTVPVDLLERTAPFSADHPVSEGTVRVELKGFEVRTLRVRLR